MGQSMKNWLSVSVAGIGLLLMSAVIDGAPLFLWPSVNREIKPPTLIWKVLDKTTGKQQDYTDQATIKTSWGKSYRITLVATDPEGLESIVLQPEASWVCVRTSGGETIGEKYLPSYAAQKSDFESGTGKNVQTASLIKEWDFNFSCSDGYSFDGGGVKLHGQASNYANLTTAVSIRFDIGQ